MDEISQGLDSFRAQRSESARKYFRGVLGLGFRMVLLSVIFLGVDKGLSMAQRLTWPQHLALYGSGVWCFCGGIVLCSTCPLKELDVEAVLVDNVYIRRVFAIAFAVHEAILGIVFLPRVHILSMACILLLLTPPLPAWSCSTKATIVVLSLIINLLGYLSIEVWAAAHPTVLPPDGVHVPDYLLVSSACVRFLGAASLTACWLRTKRREATSGCRGGHGLRAAFYIAVYGYLLTCGAADVLRGVMLAIHDHDVVSGGSYGNALTILLGGLGFIMPPCVVLAFGSANVFEFFQRRFQRNRRRNAQAAAFIASLQDSVYIKEGMEWWQFRPDGHKDLSFDSGDIQYHWRRGIITEVRPDGFKLSYEQACQVETKTKDDNPSEWVPMASGNTSGNELLALAKRTLRCVEWSNLTLDLLKSGPICGSSDSALQANLYYNMSRDVREDEEIDFFISHSWSDDADAKYAVLESVVASFQNSKGRSPIFWFDKVCIDQERIADGLRVLPVFVNACNHMLILCGSTYATRLWCIWEIFVLVAFVKVELAIERLYFAPLDGDGTRNNILNILGELENFDVANASCFNPNDQARLSRIIHGLGDERFNNLIHEIARACAQRDADFRVSRVTSHCIAVEDYIGHMVTMNL